ncbi:DUF1499 domain-containing protein [Porticoccaceae bacterium]|nr:DUF1499 domain-containing protein [Porticoccaceae bacterium]
MLKIINWSGQGAFLLSVLTVLGYRAAVLPFRIAFLLFVIALVVCTIVSLLGLVGLSVARYQKKPVRLEFVLVVVACTICPSVALFSVGLEGIKAPMIHDISSDTDNPPEFIFTLEEQGYRENSLRYAGASVSIMQRQAYPEVTTLYVEVAPRVAYQKALFVASILGWTISAQDSMIHHFEAQATTAMFGFVDDIAVRITPLDKGSSAIDIRSVSRVGVSDFGANANRIGLFFTRLKVELENL